MNENHKNLEKIWKQVPPDYYQRGIRTNFLQKYWHTRKLDEILKLISIRPKSILDVGCASGWLLNEIHKCHPYAQCTGIDVYASAILYGKKKYKNLNLLQADAHHIPFPDNSFDVVICAEVLEHVSKPENVLKEIYRVLKSDGIAIVEMDTGNWIFKFIWNIWTNVFQGVWRDSHIHSFNTQKLEKMILKNNFLLNKKIFNFTMAVIFQLRKISK